MKSIFESMDDEEETPKKTKSKLKHINIDVIENGFNLQFTYSDYNGSKTIYAKNIDDVAKELKSVIKE